MNGTWTTTGGGGGGALAGLLVVVGAIALAIHAVWAQIIEAVRVVVQVVEVVCLVIAGTAGIAVVGGAVLLAMRLRARILTARAQRAVPAAQVIQLSAPQGVTSTPAAAIEAPRAAAWPLPGTWREINPSIEERA